MNEIRRLEIQRELDAQKTSAERNKLGQFATPTALAREVISYGLHLLGTQQLISFFDPAFGTGSFLSALEHSKGERKIEKATAFEIDRHYGDPARSFWETHSVDIRLQDFTTASPNGDTYNFLICNPPYVRHHHLSAEQKTWLNNQAALMGVRLSGLAGLYCHFIIAAQKWMAPNGIAGWLIPSEFMDVNYGAEIKKYLLDRVTLLRIHRFDPNDLQFDDALVSSAVVWVKNAPPPADHFVEFSYGGTHELPTLIRQIPKKVLAKEPKWTRFPLQEERVSDGMPLLSDFFQIKRGIATGDNTYFIIDEERASSLEIPDDFLQPVLPSPRNLNGAIVEADEKQNPIVSNPKFLINCRLPEQEVERKYPKLWAYLEEGKVAMSKRYLCSKRKIWYLQEQRAPSLFVCTYMGRGSAADERPVRFVLNKSRAVVTNSYLMLYPKTGIADRLYADPILAERVWNALNEISGEALKENGRVYGGGLHKMEPSELASLPAGSVAKLISGMALPANTLFDL